MAEFEELRLTVNLVDSASTGLQRVRSEIGQLTQTAQVMTSGLVAATTGLTNFASNVSNVQPKLRSLNTEMREMQRHATETGKALGSMAMSARQGFAGMPAIALSLYDAAGGVKGLGEAMKSLTPVARISTQALIGVGIGVVAVGAAVVAYGVSVFRLAKDMDQLNRTARTMGMSFAELKNAQDQAKAFGGSAEEMVRTFQGVQQAQLDLYKSNSQLRQKLVSKGVDANWIDALGAMDPTEFTNAAVKYAKSLEQQWLASGAIPAVARAQANKFLSEFGISINLMDMPELKPPTEKAKQEAAKLAKLSKDVMDIWNPMTVKMEMIKLEALKAGLPLVKQALDFIDQHMDSIKTGIDAVGTELKTIGTLYAAIQTPGNYEGWWADALFGKKGESSIRDLLEWMAAKMGRDTSGLDATTGTGKPGELGKVGQGGNLPGFQSGTPAPVLPPELTGPSALRPDEAKKSIQDKFQKFGANDNGGDVSATRFGFMTQELTDKTELNTGQMGKLTEQLEKLNRFYEGMETKGGGGFGGGGASGSWGGGGGGGGGGSPEPAPSTGSAGGESGGGGGGGGGGGSPSPAPSTGSASGEGGVSKTDAEKIFSGGKVDPNPNVPAATTSASVGTGGEASGTAGAATGAGAVTAVGGGAPAAFITHHTSGRGSIAGVEETLRQRGLGVQYVMDREGHIKQTGGPGSKNILPSGMYDDRGGHSRKIGDFPVGDPRRGLSNANVVGMEIIAKDDKDVTPAQAAAYAEFMKKYYPNTPIYGHGEVNVGHKEKDEGLTAKRAALALRTRSGATSTGRIGGGYPSSLLTGAGAGSGIGLGASIGSRADLDRGALNENTKIDASGSVKVQVGGKTASETVDKSELFKKGSMTNMEQMPHTATHSTGGPTVDETAKQYMASR